MNSNTVCMKLNNIKNKEFIIGLFSLILFAKKIFLNANLQRLSNSKAHHYTSKAYKKFSAHITFYGF